MRRMIVAAVLAAATGAAAFPAFARAHVDVIVGVAPPAARYEVVPAPRVGWVWVPGVWQWRHHHYAWVPGRWLHARPGLAYVPAGWVRSHDRWAWRAGVWIPRRR